MTKLAAILTAPDGWDYDSSRAADRGAVANYMAWSSHVPPDRLRDAEPMLTDDGNIRLEWKPNPNSHRRIAEIGSNSLYLIALAELFEDVRSTEIDHFDEAALDNFFLHGVID